MILSYILGQRYKVKRLFGEPLELYRCQSDGTLLTNAMVKTGMCAGHRITQPAVPSIGEYILIQLRILK